MSVDVDSFYVTEDSNVETIEEVCSPEEEFDSRLLSGNLSNLRFPLKLWRIVTDCATGAIQWIHGGKAIAINYDIFEKEYLDASKRLFKTNNITSFVRQLNLYGFRKVPKNSKSGAPLEKSFSSAANYSVFHHESFKADRPDLLLHVNRRGIKPDGKKNRLSTRPRRDPRRRTTTTSSDSETSGSESSNSTEQVIEDGIVDLDQAELIIPFGNQHEMVEEIVPFAIEMPVFKSKRKSQHQLKNVEAKRLRGRSESAAISSIRAPVYRSGSLSSSSSMHHQQVAEEFIRKVRSTSESKDEFSNGSDTNSADEEEDEDERDGTIRVANPQFMFAFKQLTDMCARANEQEKVRERVIVETLSRHFEPETETKEEQVREEPDVIEEEVPDHEVELKEEEIVEEVVEETDLLHDDEQVYLAEENSEQQQQRNEVDDRNENGYFADERNTARALLSLTCAKLQRDVSGLTNVMEPSGLTAASMS